MVQKYLKVEEPRTRYILFCCVVHEVPKYSLGEACVSSRQCLPANAVCSSQRVCICAEAFFQRGTDCGTSPVHYRLW